MLALLEGSIVDAILWGLGMFIVARIVIWLLRVFIIAPIRIVRFKRAQKTLETQVNSLRDPITLWRSWPYSTPGALAVKGIAAQLAISN